MSAGKRIFFSFISLLAMLWVYLGVAQRVEAHTTQEWVDLYRGPGNGENKPQLLALDSSGNLLVSGWVAGLGGLLDISTIKYNSQGVRLWTATFNGAQGLQDMPNDMVVDAQGNVFITGSTEVYTGGNYNTDILLLKYNANGVLQWSTVYSGTGLRDDAGMGLALDSEGNIIVCGALIREGASAFGWDGALLKFNPAGQLLWMHYYNGPGNIQDFYYDLVLDADDNIYVTGQSGDIGENYDIIIAEYTPGGGTLWVERYDGPADGNERADFIALDNDQNIYVAGGVDTRVGVGINLDYGILKYDNLGTLLWDSFYDGTGNGIDWPTGMELGPNGNIYVSGYSMGSAGFDIATLCYSPTGVQQWAARYDDPDHGLDQGYAMTLDARGNIYVTGTGSGTEVVYGRIVTLRYSPSGVQQWIAEYDASSTMDEFGTDVIVDAGRNVYVTGESVWRWATIRYSQPEVLVVLQPQSLPIQIPPGGGSFNYTLYAVNEAGSSQTFQIWCNVLLPDSSTYGPVVGPVSVTLPDGVTLGRSRTQQVPGSALPGNYVYNALLGTYPNNVQDYDSFAFVKLGSGVAGSGDWFNTGEDFANEAGSTQPSVFSLPSVFPNPFNLTTAISYKLQAASQVSLRVYDTAGRLVTTLVDRVQEAGQHSVTFDGSKLASGLYFVQMQAGTYTAVQKMMLLK